MELINIRYKLLAVCCCLIAIAGSSCSERPTSPTTEQNAGGELLFTVCVKKNGQWLQYQDFKMYVSKYRLDEYGVTYRRIAPGYEVGGDIGIYQRDIHSFDESAILAESVVPGQCMNCHVANRANPNTFNMQIRGEHGGTLLYKDGKQIYLTTKTDSTVANTSYSYWHPDGDYCAFSTNSIHQSFFVGTGQRIEVYDTFSNVCRLMTGRHTQPFRPTERPCIIVRPSLTGCLLSGIR